MRLFTYLAIMLWALGANANTGEWVSQPHSSARLLAEQREMAAGQDVTLGLHLKLDPGWHAYWKNPGDSGMATQISWTLPEGFTADTIQWPAPRRIDTGPVTSYGYDDAVLLMTSVQVPGAFASHSATFVAQADWLVCKEICIPASAKLTLSLPISSQPAPDETVAALFNSARQNLPRPLSGWNIEATKRATEVSISLTPGAGTDVRLKNLSFIPDREGDIDDSFEQVFERTGTNYNLRLKSTDVALANLSGVLVAESGFGSTRSALIDIPVSISTTEPAARADMTFVAALALALAGGLILNLMPCVFPVLAIKILGAVECAHGQTWKLKEHALLFTLGVLASFLAVAAALLALRAQGAALGWGFQLQSPAVVTGLALLFFVLGLNLSGVFQLGARVQSVAGTLRLKNERMDALASGLLATLVASPCTAPFMGAALGYAVTQPVVRALVVFAVIALGMALPYALLCFFPGALRRLPRPGPWMETLKQFLAFPLYATVVWLVWVLGQQIGIDGAAKLLLALVVLACALWLWARPRSTALRQITCAGLLIVALATAWPWNTNPARGQGNEWLPWSEGAVQSALAAGQPVFVDFTAAWCVSCQVNKQLVLHREAVTRGFAQSQVLRLRADWTNKDPEITHALERLGRNGVPVYALYTPGQAQPKLLPEILTQGILLEALAALPVKTPKVDRLTLTKE
ncbi:MAG: protein-disulfide reductase DsbD family protein [Burkholderiales bacterium]